jgi:hypothetical protein
MTCSSTVAPAATVTVRTTWVRTRSWVCPWAAPTAVRRQRTVNVAVVGEATSTVSLQSPAPDGSEPASTAEPPENENPGAIGSVPVGQDRVAACRPAGQACVVETRAPSAESGCR